MNSHSAINVVDFIDRRPVAAMQWVLLGLCFLVIVADGMDVAIMGFLAPSILQEWGGSRGSFGVVMSAALIGLIIGALLAGPISDRFGRKAVLVGSVFLFGVFTISTGYARNPTELAGLRFLTGLGLGAVLPNSATLLSEYAPQRWRSLMIAIMSTGFSLGTAVVGFLAAWLIPLHGWRAVLLPVGVAPLVLLPLLWLLLPESARFMIVRGEDADRIGAVLGKVCGTTFARGTTFFAPEPPVLAKTSVGVLFSKGYGAMTAALWSTYFMGLLFIYLMMGWLPTLIRDAGLSIASAANVTAMFQIGGTAGALFIGWAMDRARPTRVIGIAYAAGAVSLVLLGAGGVRAGSLAFTVGAAGFFMIGAHTGLNAYAPTCYPTRARGTGVSWMLGVGRFGGIAGSMVGGVLLTLGWGFTGIMSALAVPALLAATAILGARRRTDTDVVGVVSENGSQGRLSPAERP